jgi:hypothetical protein
LAVTAEEYERVTGEKPDEMHTNPFYEGLFNFYLTTGRERVGQKVRYRLEVEEMVDTHA